MCLRIKIMKNNKDNLSYLLLRVLLSIAQYPDTETLNKHVQVNCSYPKRINTLIRMSQVVFSRLYSHDKLFDKLDLSI